MNKTQFTVKVEELTNQLQKPLLVEALRLFESGAIDTQKYGDDDQLPKICLSVALGNVRAQFEPRFLSGIREARNLERF